MQSIEVKVRFRAEVVRWMRERQHYGFQREGASTPNGVTMIYHVHDTSEITPWILGWGAAAEVLSPKELRKDLRETAQKLADLLT
jgi:proteasome accessory factor B